MKARFWLPPVVFLATALPTVMLLHALDLGGEYRLFIGIGVGALATSIAQTRLAKRDDDGPGR